MPLMKPLLAVIALASVVAAAPAQKPSARNQGTSGVDWPQFRGLGASGVAEGFSLPATWNAADGTNVVWKTPIPGLGLSSPIVWKDEVFISTSISGRDDAG